MTEHRAGQALWIGVLLSFAPSAVAKDAPGWLTERRIIGDDGLEPVEEARETATYDMARIVARMEDGTGRPFCTGARVGPDLFMTNYHCYDYKPCERVQFHLGYERDLAVAEQATFACAEVLASNETYDYALYRVGPAQSVPAYVSRRHRFERIGLAIPDNDPAGAAYTFDVDQQGEIRDLRLSLIADHGRVGDLQVTVTAPSGRSVLIFDREMAGSVLNLSFDSSGRLAALLHEPAAGTWTITLADLAEGETGELRQVDMSLITGVMPEQRRSAAKLASEYPTARLWAGELHVDQALVIASHPAGRMKEIDRSDGCKLRTIEPEMMQRRRTITHTCDSEGGSSGSPVLDRETGRVVALHWGGVEGFNMAIPMSLIIDDLHERLGPDDFAALDVAR
jgi:subtilisin-like proprotein convertase family protein/V8-like Glu-specific endopeptidase